MFVAKSGQPLDRNVDAVTQADALEVAMSAREPAMKTSKRYTSATDYAMASGHAH